MSPKELAAKWALWEAEASGPAVFDAILGALAEEREACAQMANAMARQCDSHGTPHFCEWYGCSAFDELAAAIRERGEAATPVEGER